MADRRSRPPERKVVTAVHRLLRREGCLEVIREVQFGDRFIDVFAWTDTPRRYVAVEAKVAAPQRAFLQARRHLPVAHRVYVALYVKTESPTATRLAVNTGIGLILVRGDRLGRLTATVHRQPKDSPYVEEWLALRICDMWYRAHRSTGAPE